MSKNTTIKERILQFIENKGISKYKFYQETGISNGVLDKKSGLSMETVEKLLLKFPEISERWLLTGEGEMIKSEYKQEQKNEATPITAGHVKYIPLVSQYAQAGYLSGFDNKIYMDSLPTIPIIIPTDQEPKGEYVCFEVSGDSMISEEDPSESLFERDLLICRNVEQTYWLSKLHINKWDFVIVHKTEGIIVKRIVDHDVEKKQITIHSLNPMYEDRVLSLGDISQILNVVFIHRQMRR
ncbi:S24 family peptidase [Myroides marinus]|uniref:S24 family peptidase n=1 Tax=Myroides marinus TaxID=703342 RepID=UPI002575F049|nr:S24 family peptidase [Myroides marinus]MDM1378797.1 helix-turn-helix transcriptional regulator [Myroides marinus]MDM1386068.1 helix-turn-helix transcriptional regulator [Myroides marinus]MDM1393281.1 helix-turn-helix transcriptional regulator [Myroides marinus]